MQEKKLVHKNIIHSWQEGKKNICFIHGLLAHSHWWDELIKIWDYKDQSYALDLSGLGDSPWQESYSLDNHSDEIVSHIKNETILIGHSYGGLAAFAAALKKPELITKIILIDSPLAAWSTEIKPKERIFTNINYYKDKEQLLKTFKLFPEEEFQSKENKNRLFETSIIKTEQGYRYKFDPKIKLLINNIQDPILRTKNHTKIIYIKSKNSILSPYNDIKFLQNFTKDLQIIEMEGDHHSPINNPQKLVELLSLNI